MAKMRWGQGARDAVETRNKRLIATFPTESFIAEREGSELKIFIVGEADDLSGLPMTTDQKQMQGLRNLSEYYAKRFPQNNP